MCPSETQQEGFHGYRFEFEFERTSNVEATKRDSSMLNHSLCQASFQ